MDQASLDAYRKEKWENAAKRAYVLGAVSRLVSAEIGASILKRRTSRQLLDDALRSSASVAAIASAA